MGKVLRRTTLLAATLVVVAFVLFVANQTAQFVALVAAFNPTAGQFALLALLAIYAAVIVTPVILFIRLPRAVRVPADESGPQFARYLRVLRSRLASNPNLPRATPLESRADVEAALKVLDSRTDRLVKNTASAVFVSTAVSQSGRLDGLVVLVALSRMVWQIAHVYNQRPSLSDLVRLYANVGATTFAAVQIEELDVSEQVETIFGPVFGSSLVGAVPGASAVAGILVGAIVDGSANAFLALRVGLIAKRYCSSLSSTSGSVVRRMASAEAAGMLGAIMVESGAVVSKAILGAVSKAGRGALSRSAAATRERLTAALNSLTEATVKTGRGIGKPFSRGKPSSEGAPGTSGSTKQEARSEEPFSLPAPRSSLPYEGPRRG